MKCPLCAGASEVIDSRLRLRKDSVYRRRRCLDCDYAWTTYEHNASLRDDQTKVYNIELRETLAQVIKIKEYLAKIEPQLIELCRSLTSLQKETK